MNNKQIKWQNMTHTIRTKDDVQIGDEVDARDGCDWVITKTENVSNVFTDCIAAIDRNDGGHGLIHPRQIKKLWRKVVTNIPEEGHSEDGCSKEQYVKMFYKEFTGYFSIHAVNNLHMNEFDFMQKALVVINNNTNKTVKNRITGKTNQGIHEVFDTHFGIE